MSTFLGTFIRNPKNTSFDGEDNDEKILYVFRRSFVTNFDWIFISAILFATPGIVGTFFKYVSPSGIEFDKSFIFVLGLFWYLVSIGFTFHNFANWFYNVYIVTNKKVVDVDFHGILYKNISEAPLKNIEDVTSNISGALEIVFNYGCVYIQTSAEQREFEFENVSNPAKIRDIISDLVSKVKRGRH